MNRNAHATIASFLRPIVTPLWHWKSTSLLRILAQPEVIQHRVRPSYQRIQDEVHSAIRSKSVHGEMAQMSLKVPFLKEAIDDRMVEVDTFGDVQVVLMSRRPYRIGSGMFQFKAITYLPVKWTYLKDYSPDTPKGSEEESRFLFLVTATYTYDRPTGIVDIQVAPSSILGTYTYAEKCQEMYAEHVEELQELL